MVDRIPAPFPAELAARLDALIPGAGLRPQAVPGLGDLELFLVDGPSVARAMDQATSWAIAAHPPYWCLVWPGGRALAQRILEANSVAGRTVIDLGCGSGVAALAAARAGASRVLAVDIDPECLAATAANAAHNGLTVETAPSLAAATDALGGPADLLVVADLLYDPHNRPMLDLYRNAAAAVWVADSRARTVDHPAYVERPPLRSAVWPDVDPSEQFRSVIVYEAGEGR